MFKSIMIPVDMRHAEDLETVFDLAAKIARFDDATLHLVHVSAHPPAPEGRTSQEIEANLEILGSEVHTKHHVPVETVNIEAHDPAVELNEQLLKATKDVSADLIIVGSHVPALGDYFFTSHGGYLAEHAEVSVFVVRNTQPSG